MFLKIFLIINNSLWRFKLSASALFLKYSPNPFANFCLDILIKCIDKDTKRDSVYQVFGQGKLLAHAIAINKVSSFK